MSQYSITVVTKAVVYPILNAANQKDVMFYLMMHLQHFIYGYMVSDMVKDH